MKLGYLQFSPILGDPDANLATIESMVDGVDADLLVLPELALTGYNLADRHEAARLAESPDESRRIDALVRLCSRVGKHLVVGFAERDGSRVYNSALLVGPGGIRGVYRKIHLFDREKVLFDPGDRPPEVFRVGGVTVGIMICFDWIFPETARVLALGGADIIAHPSNLVLEYCQSAMVTRCLENGVFAVTANRYGMEDGPEGQLVFTGGSQITGPKGEVLARAAAGGDAVGIVDIDPKMAENKAITGRNDRFADRRPEFYAPITTKKSGGT